MADTYNQKTDRQDTAGSVYQREIFKRRSRYILVFSVLTAAFLIVTVLNINTGNVHISLPEILKILARRGEGGTEANIYMEDTSATGSDGSNPWGSVVIIWILTSDFLFQSDRGTVCPWNFVRSEDDGSTGNDILSGTLCICVFLYTDCCGIYRSIDLHRFYFNAIQENEAYGHTSGRWNHDWLHLFGDHRFCRYICRGF